MKKDKMTLDGFIKFMDDLIEQAKATAKRFRAMSEEDRKIFLKEFIDKSDVVLGFFPGKRGRDDYAFKLIKGDLEVATIIEQAGGEMIGNALMCRDETEVEAIRRDYEARTKH
jgi:hypothetical protein